jgi:hypothetical protein
MVLFPCFKVRIRTLGPEYPYPEKKAHNIEGRITILLSTMTAASRIVESNASLLIISPDRDKNTLLMYCQSSSTCATPALEFESESTSATSSPSHSAPSAISAAAEQHQLPPLVHAIGSLNSCFSLLAT